MKMEENLAIEFQKHLENIGNGKKGYQLIACGPKGCHYHNDGFSGPVETAFSCVWNHAGVVSRHEVTEGKVSPGNEGFTAIIKKRKKMLLSDKGAGYFTSGMAGTDGTDATRAILYFQCNGIATFVASSSDGSEVHIVDYLWDSDEVDPLQVVLLDLLRHLPAKVHGEEGEQ